MHEGVNIGEVEYVVVKDFGIEDKLGYFLRDNASNNDMTIRSIESGIRRDGGVGFNLEERRLRCWGHIMNMFKALLFRLKAKKLEKEHHPEESVGSYIKAQTLRRCALSAVRKAHNIVKFVRTNPQR